MSRTLLVLCLYAVSTALIALGCYKGNPGVGNVDYPPEPPFVERVTAYRDGGPG